LGYCPVNVNLFELAFTHKSINHTPIANNERLEFIGDAILDCVIAEFLFAKYPEKDEGFLTQMRSKMVNRKRLHHTALQLGLDALVKFNTHIDLSNESNSALGDAMEAVIGAIFLDSNYGEARKFILQQMIRPLINMAEVEEEEISPKNKLLTWASKQRKVATFNVIEETNYRNNKIFIIQLTIDGVGVSQGKAFNKKDAEQIAAAEAIVSLGV
jgi:ribonuclease-3